MNVDQIAEGKEWCCWECGKKYFFAEPIKLSDGLEYCADCVDNIYDYATGNELEVEL